MRSTGVVVMTVVMLTATAMAAAQPAGGVRRGAGPGPRLGPGAPFDRVLDLTGEQQAAAQTLREQEFEAIRPLMERARPAQELLRALLESETQPEAAAVGEQVLAINAIVKEMKGVRETYHEKFKALLTDDQRAKLDGLESRMRPPHALGPMGPGLPLFFTLPVPPPPPPPPPRAPGQE
jgi:Spy/CpxP family protein refolding chaperone